MGAKEDLLLIIKSLISVVKVPTALMSLYIFNTSVPLNLIKFKKKQRLLVQSLRIILLMSS